MIIWKFFGIELLVVLGVEIIEALFLMPLNVFLDEVKKPL